MTYMMKKRKRTRLAFVGVLLASVSVATGCRRDTEAAAAEAEKTAGMTIGTENIAIVASGSLMSGPAISGALIPEREATVRAQIGGSVLQTYAEEGQAVRAGQPLVNIDATGVQDAFLSARAAVTSASNNADIAARELARSEKLLAAGAIAEREIEQVRRNAIAANAALADARARLASAQRQLNNTRVVAPISGIVSDRPASAGDVVQAGTALVTVVDPSSMRLEAAVPSDQLASVRIGVPVTFSVTGYPGREITGRITRVNPTADPATRQVRITVSIPNAEGRLVGGLYANGRLASESHTGLMAPLSAIDARSGTPAVLRIKQGRVERVPVQLGLRDEGAEKIELVSGVQAGDTLLLGAAQGITPGTVLRVSVPSDNPVTVTKEKR
jgi:membrane fusion protein (multidrug efflux system)